MKARISLAVLLVHTTCISFSQTNSNRFALVIGVQNYSSVSPLRHSISDANDMSVALKSKGFKIETLIDPKTKKEIKDAVTRYYNIMKSQSGAVGIIYYAGHGIQSDGENYLIPATANLQVPGDLDDQCVKMNVVMSVLNSSNSNLNIFLLDACRTNAFPSFNRDAVKGLANVEAPKGSIVVFAMQPGTVASDGAGKNGLFTSKLLKYINEPNLNIGDVFKKVKQDVNAESEGKQLPSVVDNSIGGDFYFTSNRNATVNNNSVAQPIVKSEKTLAHTPFYSYPSIDFGYGSAKTSSVRIGDQEWITQNLNVDHFANGDPVAEARTPYEWQRAGIEGRPAWCYYNNDPANGSTYGKLYNWYAVNDPRGLAPRGWHLPTDTEWDIIILHLAGKSTEVNKPLTSGNSLYYTTEGVGTLLKSTDGWTDYNGASGNGNNSSGIAGRPGGYAGIDGTFYYLGKLFLCWSSTENSTGSAWSRYLYNENSKVAKLRDDKRQGFSVRCLKD